MPVVPRERRASGRKLGAEPDSGLISRKLILDKSAALFSARGFAETSIREIADEVGIRSGSVYYHFPSKEDILTEIIVIAIQSTFEEVKTAVEALPASADSREKIIAAVVAHLRVLHRDLSYTMTAARYNKTPPSDAVLQSTRPLRERYNSYWKSLFSEAEADGYLNPGVDASILRRFILYSMNHATFWYDARTHRIDDLIETFKFSLKGFFRNQAIKVEPLPLSRGRSHR